jgi:shikimate dehydrogenase
VTAGLLRLAVLGDPLAYTRSPELHRAGCAALGLACESEALRTPPDRLAERLDELEAAGYDGVNLTHPLKAPALACAGVVSDAARRARSVNTIGFEADGRWGETTDGAGFLDLLRELGRSPAEVRTLLLGAGGSARSLALALHEAGASAVVVSARDPERRARTWSDVPARWVAWRTTAEQDALAEATLVVNCTPLTSEDGPAALVDLPAGGLILDLVYAERLTRWVTGARSAGFEAYDGLGLLVHQARHSLERWTGRTLAVKPLAAAVGWPR